MMRMMEARIVIGMKDGSDCGRTRHVSEAQSRGLRANFDDFTFAAASIHRLSVFVLNPA